MLRFNTAKLNILGQSMKILNINLAAMIGSVVLTLAACGGGSPSAPAPTQPPTAAAWSATGSLQTARYGHTATLLPSGKVLIAGGIYMPGNGLANPGAPVYPASVELYDPTTRVWTAAAALGTARSGHTATVLPNGKVLVAGGLNAAGPCATVELYDAASNTWTVVQALSATRLNHTATLLPNGKVLVAGGYDGFGNMRAGVEIYDPAANTWASGSPLAAARYSHTATVLPNGKVLVAGGWGSAGTRPAIELYDPATDAWTLAGTLATAHEAHTATLLSNGTVLVAGGGYTSVHSATTYATDMTELYDPATNTWSLTNRLIVGPRLGHTATLLRSGAVLVAGGTQASGWLYQSPGADAALYEFL
jgi:N-acetylneuraminic acid mutarotase